MRASALLAVVAIMVSAPRVRAQVPEPVPAATPPAPARWLSRLYEQTSPSVVLIQIQDGSIGSGFLYHSRRHVATAYHVVEEADVVAVTVPGYLPVRSRVVAWDEDADVAIVELPEAIPDRPVLEPYHGPIEIGMPVAAIGHPFAHYASLIRELEGLLNWTLTQGVIGMVSHDFIQIDAAVNPGNSGGPLLASDGRVLGVVSARLERAEGIGFASRIDALERLVPTIGQREAPRPIVKRDAVEIGFMFHFDSDTLTGPLLGGGLMFARRVPLRLRAAYVDGTEEVNDPAIIRRNVDRISFELEAGYVLPWFVGIEIAFLAGAAMDIDLLDDARATAIDDGSCTPTPMVPCVLPTSVEHAENMRFEARMQVGATVTYSFLRLSYGFQIDFVDFGASVHRLLIAAAI